MEQREFAHIVAHRQGEWLALGKRFFGNDDDAADALQETLMRLWVVHDRLQTESDVVKLGTWIMKNECVNIYRKARLREAPPPDIVEPPDTVTPHSLLERAQEKEMLRWAVENISLSARCLLQMHLYDGMSLDEIADATGKPKNSIRTTLCRAKQRIAQWIRTID